MRKYRWFLPVLACWFAYNSSAQTFHGDEPFAHTYSIVAIDEATGDMGVAVQSHWYSVGTIVTWGEAGVGVVATQSFVNPQFGPDGLELMKMGFTAPDVVDILVERDEGRDVRQLAILDAQGNCRAYTGSKCIQSAGHIEGKGYTVQANLMRNDDVWPAMSEAFENSTGQPLAERLVLALEAAEAAGGDIRGKQSAAVLVVSGEASGKPWVDRKVDIRVDDHKNPIKEISRLLRVHRAYEHMNKGDLAVEHGDVELAKKEYGSAEGMFPENEEMKYWHAVSLANVGEIDEALLLFKKVFEKNMDWHELTPRLTANGLLNVNDTQLKQILNVINKKE